MFPVAPKLNVTESSTIRLKLLYVKHQIHTKFHLNSVCTVSEIWCHVHYQCSTYVCDDLYHTKTNWFSYLSTGTCYEAQTCTILLHLKRALQLVSFLCSFENVKICPILCHKGGPQGNEASFSLITQQPSMVRTSTFDMLYITLRCTLDCSLNEFGQTIAEK